MEPSQGGMMDYVADIVSAAALVFSLYVYATTRPKLIVALSSELDESRSEGEDDYPVPPEEWLVLDIVNPSRGQRIKIQTIWIEWDKKRELYPNFYSKPDKKMPFWLGAGDNAPFSTSPEDFKYWLQDCGARGKVRVRAAVRDAMGNWYRSRWLALDVPARSNSR